jgi:hypothetical protein
MRIFRGTNYHCQNAKKCHCSSLPPFLSQPKIHLHFFPWRHLDPLHRLRRTLAQAPHKPFHRFIRPRELNLEFEILENPLRAQTLRELRGDRFSQRLARPFSPPFSRWSKWYISGHSRRSKWWYILNPLFAPEDTAGRYDGAVSTRGRSCESTSPAWLKLRLLLVRASGVRWP